MFLNKTSKNTLIWVTLFSIAMGFLECSVVVYLRELYYPHGFDFPMKAFSERIIIVELIREASTLLMIVGIGALSGRNFAEKFGYFLFSFAIWDVCYYAFLKIILNWPASLMTWDILFLIPSTWTGPVLAPILLSITMIAFSLIIIRFTNIHGHIKISSTEWTFLILGSIILMVVFCWDYSSFILQNISTSDMFDYTPNSKLMSLVLAYIPKHFSWIWFSFGFFTLIIGIALFFRRYRRLNT
jgi:hypothetical protein